MLIKVFLLIVILVIFSVAMWRFAKNIGVAPKFRIYLISIVVIIVISICASLFIESCTDGKNNDNNNKEEVIIEL